jgi:hypothetical protein
MISSELDAAVGTFAVDKEGDLYDAITKLEVATGLLEYLFTNGWTIEKKVM